MKVNPEDLTIYFASPWFNPEQAEREDRVKSKLRELGFNVWSPKDSCVCPPNASAELRKRTFMDNCDNISICDVLFAITDGKDMGTIWEAGYACGLNDIRKNYGEKQILIVYYCESLGSGKFNLMLANSGDLVITDFDDLEHLCKLINIIRDGGQIAYAGQIE